MRLIFSYDVDKEFINLQAGNRSLNRTVHSGFSDRLESLGFDISSQKSVANGCRGIIRKEGIDPEKQVGIFAEKWHPVENVISRRFDKLFEIVGTQFDIIAYLSLNERCSYSSADGYFFINIFSGKPIMVCLHEIFHLYTHKFIKLEVSPQTYNSYKESLTVLLDQEFGDLIEREDKGYPQHKELRKYIDKKHTRGSSIIELTRELFVDDIFLALLKDIV